MNNKDQKIKGNYHTHTVLCGHARGEAEDYIKEAILAGLDELGFSEHCSMPEKSFYRCSFEDIKKYFNEIDFLKEKYKNKIKIFKGLEVDYFHEYDKLMKIFYENCDYLCLSCHTTQCIGENVYAKSTYGIEDENELEKYKNIIIDGMKTQMFSFVCHPDIFMNGLKNVTSKHKEVFEEICKASIKYDIPLEYNANGLRRMEYNNFTREQCYPNKELFLIAKRYNVKVIINGDCHDPELLRNDDYHMNLALEEAKELGLNLIEKIEFKKR